MTIYVGSDHAGYGLKDALVDFLKRQGHEVIDKGAFNYNEADDYTDFTVLVAQAISKDPRKTTRGIILGATGQGETIAANRFPNVRAVTYYGKAEFVVNDESDIISRSRNHYDANVLALGVRYLTEDSMLNAVKDWLSISFDGEEKFIRRITKIDAIKT